MVFDDGATGEQPGRIIRPRSRLFAVRLWTEEVAGGQEHRGSVRDVASGAFRGFREWSDLIAFLITRIEDDDRVDPERTEGGTEWSLRTKR